MTPSNWQAKSVGDVCNFVNGNGFKSSEWSERGLPIIRIQNLNGSNEFNYFEGEIKKKWIVKPGDILFAWAGTKGVSFGAKLWNGPKGVLNQHIFRVEPAFDIDHKWLYLALLRVTQKVENMAHGFKATLLHVQKSDVTEQVLQVPPLPEQKKIAQILSTWDKAISTTEQLLASSQQQKKALMQQLLTGKKRLPGFSGEWEKHTLGEIGKTYTGLSGKTKEHFGKGKHYIPYMNVFSNSRIDVKKLDRVEIANGEKQYKAQYGDIFFTTSSETPDEVGMSSVLLDEIEDTYLNSFCFGYRLNDFRTMLPQFAKHLLRSEDIRRHISALGQGATRYNLSKNQLMKLELQLPMAEEQNSIASVLDIADSEIHDLNRRIDCLRQEKKALMQQLLTGKKRVTIEE
ncbi:MAG: restriction endonuclease subunit S [Syntrophorhabdus sp.]